MSLPLLDTESSYGCAFRRLSVGITGAVFSLIDPPQQLRMPTFASRDAPRVYERVQPMPFVQDLANHIQFLHDQPLNQFFRLTERPL